ncbi:hypothetical protein [Kibdelosporangium phytohabitans]|uniref:Uncharacterized protein n=1 Tax=Kibdelosporangium phytohabitans TaxID=860235 RepID=A0A0N9IDC6_9PSEU|nr:hypothetical protein [Kibdelosporangium phytohabitans]ALG12676.1 hypothetical protein AOZ06_42680 [Kibdelosporangium phytohabitans]MBE1464332.1 hypothetical protein [Kibdelosporangium phytohabitans]
MVSGTGRDLVDRQATLPSEDQQSPLWLGQVLDRRLQPGTFVVPDRVFFGAVSEIRRVDSWAARRAVAGEHVLVVDDSAVGDGGQPDVRVPVSWLAPLARLVAQGTQDTHTRVLNDVVRTAHAASTTTLAHWRANHGRTYSSSRATAVGVPARAGASSAGRAGSWSRMLAEVVLHPGSRGGWSMAPTSLRA